MIRVLLAALAFPGLVTAADSRVDHATVTRGSVTVDGIHGAGIAIGIDTEPVDGIIDDVVLLQAYGRIPPDLPIFIPDARIVISDRVAMVEDRAGLTMLTLSLASDPPNRVLVGDDEIHYTGFGFSHMPDTWGDFEEVRAFIGDPDSGSLTRDACQSGGTGATACSIDCQGRFNVLGCSAECGEGFYACCFCRPWSNWEKAYCVCETNNNSGGGGGGGGGGSGDGDDCTNDGSGCDAGCMSCRPDL